MSHQITIAIIKRILINKYGFRTSERTKSIAIAAPKIKTERDNPSLKRTKTKTKKTKAEPVSFCNKTNNIGIATMVIAANLVLRFFISTSIPDRILANANAVVALANSEGCIPKSPTPNQLLAPFVSEPTARTARSITIKTPYQR